MSEQRYGWAEEEGFFVDTLLTDKEGREKQLPREEVLEILNSRAALEAKLEAMELIRDAAERLIENMEVTGNAHTGGLRRALAAARLLPDT